MKKGIIIAGSRGIGLSIYKNLKKIRNLSIQRYNSKELDTSNLDSVKKFITNQKKKIDLLVLNTGGPPPKNFYEISEKEYFRYHIQLYYSFVYILKNLSFNKEAYIFLISSSILKEPPPNMILSNAYRTAFLSTFKSFGKLNNNKKLNCVSIAPGAIKTDRIKKLVQNLKLFEKNLPLGKLGQPNEIGKFIKFIVNNKIKYFNGSHINFDGGQSNFLF
tara:strand:- start:468 stop:1121 length:654 start_codon:yes stop_codon:yes gene_type:complete